MLALHELQRTFAAAMFEESDCTVHAAILAGSFPPAERLRIYRNTFVGTLTAALRLTYPAVERLVGRDFIGAAAERFIDDHPAQSAYLNEYGAGFGDFLEAFEPASAVPYLADVARYEWALSAAANAIDTPALDARALAGVAPDDHARLQFEAHPSLSLLDLRYAADEIADAVMSGDPAAIGELDVSPGAVRLVVHRGPHGVESQRLDRAPFEFVSGLLAGKPLGLMLENAPAEAPALVAEQLIKGRIAAFRTNTGLAA